jgi:hypothetical protein
MGQCVMAVLLRAVSCTQLGCHCVPLLPWCATTVVGRMQTCGSTAPRTACDGSVAEGSLQFPAHNLAAIVCRWGRCNSGQRSTQDAVLGRLAEGCVLRTVRLLGCVVRHMQTFVSVLVQPMVVSCA